MQELRVPPALSIEKERAELAAMVVRLGRSPRLANLLRYVGEKYLNGESEQIREYNIATEVFGRPDTFDSNQDAIARVEAHRLRKKLKEFYEAEGKARPVHIVLPSGTYVPVFVHKEEEPPVAKEPVVDDPAASAPSPARYVTPDPGRFLGLPKLVFVGAFLIAIAAVVFVLVNRKTATTPQRQVANATPTDNSLQPTGEAIRVLAGYTGQPRISSSGGTWGADRFFQGGRPDHGAQNFIGRTSDPFLFQTCRSGEFSYDVPVKPGVYEVHLYFVETSYGPGLGGGENDRTFAIAINGHVALDSFDIESDAMGPNIADERVFKNVQPAADGKIHIALESRRGEPILNAFEIVPGLRNRQLPIRMVMQPNSYMDRNGQIWIPDNYYLGGQSSIRRPVVQNATDAELYAMERFGHFTYALPVAMDGTYSLTLHFAEYYYGPKASGVGGLGSRRFNVMSNGVELLDDFDIFREAGGSLTALTKTFHHLKPSPQGKLNLNFEPISNYASISAIEVSDESVSNR